MRPCIVILNAKAGQGTEAPSPGHLERLFEARGRSAEVRVVEPEALDDTLEEVAALDTPHTIVAAGGDGTVNAVVRALLPTAHELGILPVGTANLFARALGLPLELEGAVAVVAAGQARDLDLGQVEDRIFVNNCAVGMYAELSRRRERLRERHQGWWKPLRWIVDTVLSAWIVMRAWRLFHVRMRLGGAPEERRVPMVGVTTNDYSQGFPGRRDEDPELAVYVPRTTGALTTFFVALKVVLQGVQGTRRLEVHRARSLEIRGAGPLPLAVDGEVTERGPTLRFEALPRALRVCAPSGRADPSEAA